MNIKESCKKYSNIVTNAEAKEAFIGMYNCLNDISIQNIGLYDTVVDKCEKVLAANVLSDETAGILRNAIKELKNIISQF